MKPITQIDMFGRKECSACRRVMPLNRFVRDTRKKRGVTSDCKDCRAARSRDYNKRNPDKIRASNARPESKIARDRWWQIHGERVKAERRAKAQTPEGRAKDAARARARRRRDPRARLLSNLRSRINLVLRGKSRAGSAIALLGCTPEQFRAHIERQWAPGMSWDNYGIGSDKWQVDHIRPCASFDLSDPGQQHECFHYSNCQPLWALENGSKGAKFMHERTRT